MQALAASTDESDTAGGERAEAIEAELVTLAADNEAQAAAVALVDAQLALLDLQLTKLQNELLELLELQILAGKRSAAVESAHAQVAKVFESYKRLKTLVLYIETLAEVRDQLKLVLAVLRRSRFGVEAIGRLNCTFCLKVGVRAGFELGLLEVSGKVEITLSLSGTLAVLDTREVEFGHRFSVLLTAAAIAKVGVSDEQADAAKVLTRGLVPIPDVLLEAAASAQCTLYDRYDCLLYRDDEHFLASMSYGIARRLTLLRKLDFKNPAHLRRSGAAPGADWVDALMVDVFQDPDLPIAPDMRALILRGAPTASDPPRALVVKRTDWGVRANLSVDALGVNALERGSGPTQSARFKLSPGGATKPIPTLALLQEHLLYFKNDGTDLSNDEEPLEYWSEPVEAEAEPEAAVAPKDDYATAVFHSFSRVDSAPDEQLLQFLEVQTYKASDVTALAKGAATSLLTGYVSPKQPVEQAAERKVEQERRYRLAQVFDRLKNTGAYAEKVKVPEAVETLLGNERYDVRGLPPDPTLGRTAEAKLTDLLGGIGARIAVLREGDSAALRTAVEEIDPGVEGVSAASNSRMAGEFAELVAPLTSGNTNVSVRYVAQPWPAVTAAAGIVSWHWLFTPELHRGLEFAEYQVSVSGSAPVMPFLSVTFGAGLHITGQALNNEVLGLDTFSYLKTVYAPLQRGGRWGAFFELHEGEILEICARVAKVGSGPFIEVAWDVVRGPSADQAPIAAARVFGAACWELFEAPGTQPFAAMASSNLAATLLNPPVASAAEEQSTDFAQRFADALAARNREVAQRAPSAWTAPASPALAGAAEPSLTSAYNALRALLTAAAVLPTATTLRADLNAARMKAPSLAPVEAPPSWDDVAVKLGAVPAPAPGGPAASAAPVPTPAEATRLLKEGGARLAALDAVREAAVTWRNSVSRLDGAEGDPPTLARVRSEALKALIADTRWQSKTLVSALSGPSEPSLRELGDALTRAEWCFEFLVGKKRLAVSNRDDALKFKAPDLAALRALMAKPAAMPAADHGEALWQRVESFAEWNVKLEKFYFGGVLAENTAKLAQKAELTPDLRPTIKAVMSSASALAGAVMSGKSEVPTLAVWLANRNDKRGFLLATFGGDSTETKTLDAAVERAGNELNTWTGQTKARLDVLTAVADPSLTAGDLDARLDEIDGILYGRVHRLRDLRTAVAAWGKDKDPKKSDRMPTVVERLELPVLREFIKFEALRLMVRARSELVRARAAYDDFQALGGAPPVARPLRYFYDGDAAIMESTLEAPLATARLKLLSAMADVQGTAQAAARASSAALASAAADMMLLPAEKRAAVGRALSAYLEATSPRYANVGLAHAIRQERLPGVAIPHETTSETKTTRQKVEDALREQIGALELSDDAAASIVGAVVSDTNAERLAAESARLTAESTAHLGARATAAMGLHAVTSEEITTAITDTVKEKVTGAALLERYDQRVADQLAAGRAGSDALSLHEDRGDAVRARRAAAAAVTPVDPPAGP